MSPSTRQCPSCTTPLPGDAVFCPRCGHATPTEISLGTGEVRQAPSVEVGEAEYRTRLGRALGAGYELRELLGRGGFGAVYVAWEVRLEREVAVKALRPDLFASPQLLERFEREAKAAAKLRHPNILPLYAVGEGEGLAYMVMPRVQGESLRDLLDREETLSIDEARRIVAEAAAGLGAAHEAGIVHRDIKPENIMLEGPERRVLLMDFGIAKAMGTGETGLTATGMIVGTPQYMSPEQATGEREIGPAADLYSLGIVAFQMLTGRLPFEANTIEQLIVTRATTDAPDLRSFRSDVPADLAAAISRCLARNPRNRWPSAAALSVAVTPVSAGHGAPRSRSRRSWRRPVVVTAAGVLVLAAVALLGYRVVVSRSAPLEGECLNLVARHYVALRTSQCDTASFEVAQVLSGDSIRSALLRAVTGSDSSLSVESFTLVPPSARRNAAEAAEVYDTRVTSGKSDVSATISIAIAQSTYLRRLGLVTFSSVPSWAPRLADDLARELAGSGLSSLDRASVDVDSICMLLRRTKEGGEARGTCGTKELVNDDPFRRSAVPNAYDAVVQAAHRLGLTVMEMSPLPMSDDSVVVSRWRFSRGTDSTAAAWLRGVELGIPRQVVVAVAADTRAHARRILNTIDSAMAGEGKPLRRVALPR